VSVEFIKTVVQGARILVIDDNVTLANAFGKALDLAGYRVSIAYDAATALEDIARQRPDAVVLDLQMPLINGAGFLYRFRSNAALADIPVLVVTGQLVTDELQAELRDLKAPVMRKPVGIAELVTAIRRLLNEQDIHAEQPGDH
jgi:DNA-binding response OmpR family regulator